MKKHIVGISVCAFVGACCLIGAIFNRIAGQPVQAYAGPVLIALFMFGLAIYNLVRWFQFSRTGFINKATGKHIKFEPTAKTKGIWIDDTNKLWQIRFTFSPKTFHYSDLKDYEIVKETQRVLSGSSQAQRTMFGTMGSSTQVSSQMLSYLALEIKLVNMQRFRWVLNVYRKHESLADAEDAAELLKYIKDNQ